MDVLDEADQELTALAAKLHHTEDAVKPAARMEKLRRHIQTIAGSSIKLNFLLTVALFLSVGTNFVLSWFATHPDRQYFAADNGRILPMVPMSKPYRTTADVIQFAKDKMNRSFTLDFQNWRQQLEDSRSSYTREGFKSFLVSLQFSGVLEKVRSLRMNLSISAGTGVLTKEGIENGVYVWYVQTPIELKLVGQTTAQPPQRFMATLRIERISTLDSVEGIGIGQLVTKPRRGDE